METPAFIVTAVILVAYELVKSLIAKGLSSKESIEEALWKKSVTDSLSTLIQMTDRLAEKVERQDTQTTSQSHIRRQ